MRSRTIVAIMFGIVTAANARAASVVTLSPASAHPTQAITLSATGFGDSEAVDIYVDTVDSLLLVTSATGTLSASVTVPAAAQPGTHYITAIGRHSGDAAQTKVNITTPWVELGYGQARLGLNPYENTLSPSNVSSLGVLWSIPANGTGSAPVVYSGRVVASGAQGIEEVSAATGAVIWSKLNTETFYASPTLSASIYIGGSSGNFYDLNFATGAIIWSKALSTYSVWDSSAVVSGSAVYVGAYGSSGGVVYALNKTTGATLWSYPTSSGISSSPAVANGILYIGCSNGNLYALNAATGSLIWSYATGAGIHSSPAVANGTVFFGANDDNVYALQADTGALVWSYATGAAVTAQPAIANGTVFVGSEDKTMYALNALTGALQWSDLTNGLVGSAVVANGVVYVTSQDGSVYAFDAGFGGILAAGTLGSSDSGSPIVSDGVVYLNALEGNLTALALQGGTSAAVPAKPDPKLLHPDTRLIVAN